MREKGTKNKKKRYVVKVKNMKKDEWEELNTYTSYAEIAEKLKLSYDMIRNIKNGRSKLTRFIRIEKVEDKKEDEEE